MVNQKNVEKTYWQWWMLFEMTNEAGWLAVSHAAARNSTWIYQSKSNGSTPLTKFTFSTTRSYVIHSILYNLNVIQLIHTSLNKLTWDWQTFVHRNTYFFWKLKNFLFNLRTRARATTPVNLNTVYPIKIDLNVNFVSSYQLKMKEKN